MSIEQMASNNYPVGLEIQYPEKLSRLLIFVKWLLAFPHLIILGALWFAAWVVLIIAFYAILFTGRYPRGLFGFVTNVMRWNAKVTAYVSLLRDEYPPFSGEPDDYPVTFSAEYPDKLNRFLPFVKTGYLFPFYVIPFPLLLIPHFVVLIFLGLASYIVGSVAWFAILFTGRYPRGLFNFNVGVLRWSARVSAYFFLLTDRYPPFSLGGGASSSPSQGSETTLQ